MAITLTSFYSFGMTHVLATPDDSLASQVFSLGPMFFINSERITSAPAALPFLTALSAISVSFLEKSFTNDVDSLHVESSFAYILLASAFV